MAYQKLYFPAFLLRWAQSIADSEVAAQIRFSRTRVETEITTAATEQSLTPKASVDVERNSEFAKGFAMGRGEKWHEYAVTAQMRR